MVRNMNVSRNIALTAVVMAGFMFTAARTSYSNLEGKNVLRIWFDTITVDTTPSTVFMNCWYKLEVHEPINWCSFQIRYIYESHQMSPVSHFFNFSASQHASFRVGTIESPGKARVVVSGCPTQLDLTKNTLFSIRWETTGKLNDTDNNDTIGLMEVDRRFLEVTENSGIDTIIVEQGWIKYKQKHEEPPTVGKRVPVELYSTNDTLQADSARIVSLNVTSLDSAYIKYGVVSFTYDTAAISIDRVSGGELLEGVGITGFDLAGDQVVANFSAIDTMQTLTGQGELLRFHFRARPREDTLTTELTNPVLYVGNTWDDSVGEKTYSLGSITIFGAPKQTESVLVEDAGVEFFIKPSTIVSAGFIELVSGDYTRKVLRISDALGKVVFSAEMSKSLQVPTGHWASGMYRVYVSGASGCIATLGFAVIR